jgi:hypothetical protein
MPNECIFEKYVRGVKYPFGVKEEFDIVYVAILGFISDTNILS